MKKNRYVKRKAAKQLATGTSEVRNEQFEHIAELKAQYFSVGNPVISIDTKKKEVLGTLYRDGQLYTREQVLVFDHDYRYLSEGSVIPYAIYDLARNWSFVHVGTSKDTGEFVCDSLRYWWLHYGRRHYPQATSILALADSGGSNSARHYIFKEDLQRLVDAIGIEVRLAHYPPYASKWNPVEHRVFPHMSRAMQGVIFRNHEVVKHLIAKTSTQAGLKVVARISRKVYQLGRKVAADFRANMRIVFDDCLPKLNYTAVPSLSPN